MLHLSQDHPRRPVTWRWELGNLLRSLGRKGRRIKEDVYVRAAKNFQRQLVSCKNEIDRMVLYQTTPEQFMAFDIYDTKPNISGADMSGVVDNYMKSIVEAYILSGEAAAKIAKYTSVPEATIDWYEKWFFNVNDRRQAFGWVMDRVIGPAIYSGEMAQDMDTIWKLYGYFGGPRILDSAITTFSGGAARPAGSDWESFIREDARSTIAFKAAMAARAVEVSSNTVRTILEAYAHLREAEIDAEDDKSISSESFNNSVQSFVENLGWAVGLKETRMDCQYIVRYDKSSAEPRADELLAMAITGDPLDGSQRLIEAKFPEQTNNGDAKTEQGSRGTNS